MRDCECRLSARIVIPGVVVPLSDKNRNGIES